MKRIFLLQILLITSMVAVAQKEVREDSSYFLIRNDTAFLKTITVITNEKPVLKLNEYELVPGQVENVLNHKPVGDTVRIFKLKPFPGNFIFGEHWISVNNNYNSAWELSEKIPHVYQNTSSPSLEKKLVPNKISITFIISSIILLYFFYLGAKRSYGAKKGVDLYGQGTLEVILLLVSASGLALVFWIIWEKPFNDSFNHPQISFLTIVKTLVPLHLVLYIIFQFIQLPILRKKYGQKKQT